MSAALQDDFDTQLKYTHFRILVIGRANAGKTTLLKRVCNTDEEPCIYDEENNNLLEPTEERGIHDINRSFCFKSNPQFIFHDSLGFELGSETEIEKVKSFISKRAKAKEVHDQLHAIWYCIEPNEARLLLDSDKRFFEEGVAGNVPVIAIATKFDDLITQVYTREMGFEKSIEVASKLVDEELIEPLRGVKFPPSEYVRIEDMHDDDGTHQDQVKILIEKTANSLDDVFIQQLEEERRKKEEETRRREEERRKQEEETRRREEERRRRQEEERRRKALKAAENNGWTPWKGDVGSDEVGAENQGRDDRPEADFEVKEEEESRQPDAMEPEVVDVPRKEPIQENVQCRKPIVVNDRTAEQEEKSAWGTWIAPQKDIFVTKRNCGCCIVA